MIWQIDPFTGRLVLNPFGSTSSTVPGVQPPYTAPAPATPTPDPLVQAIIINVGFGTALDAVARFVLRQNGARVFQRSWILSPYAYYHRFNMITQNKSYWFWWNVFFKPQDGKFAATFVNSGSPLGRSSGRLASIAGLPPPTNLL